MWRPGVQACLAGLALCLTAVVAYCANVPATQRASTQPLPATAPAENEPTVVVDLHGEINNFSRDALFRHFADAKKLGAKTVILDVDTYGGLVTAGLEMSHFLKQQDDLHVIAFVREKAISAGAMISLACDEIVMAPGAKLGDSAPISIGSSGGMESLGQAERAKAESPILADFYESAVQNGYDPLLAQAMVAVGRTVYWVENTDTGQRRFVDEADYKKLTAPDAQGDGQSAQWKPVEGVHQPVDGPESLLTLPTDLALKFGLARGTARSIDELAQQRGLRVISTLSPSMGEHFIGWLASPILRFLLLLIFMQSLYAALHAPGHGGAEAVAVISLAGLIGIPLLTGYAQWWEVLAILLGLSLLAIEIFVIPGFGIVGISGIVLFFVGLVMTFVGTEPNLPGWLPSLEGTWQSFRRGLFIVAAGMACSMFLWFWLNRYLPRLPYFNRLILTSTSDGGTIAVDDASHYAPEGPVVGDHAQAVSDLRPGGSARLSRDGRIIAVVSESGYVKSGADLVVREIGGNRVVVRPIV